MIGELILPINLRHKLFDKVKHTYYLDINNHYQNNMRVLFTLLFILLFENLFSAEVNLFTTRHYESDLDLYRKFEKKTGIKVNVVTGKSKPLEKRILEEGNSCIGDLFFLADAGRLYSAQEKGLFKIVNSPTLESIIPPQLRSQYWFGVTKRARIIFYNPEIISYDKIKGLNYEDLSKKEFQSLIAIRQSNNVYNQSLVASLIENNGVEFTKEWLKGFVQNFSRQPQGNDRAQILSVAAGESKIAIANTYYYALMLSGKKGDDQMLAAKKVKPFFPNQKNRGTHMNISGIGILKNAPNTNNAIKFVEFLLTPEAQSHIIKNTFEYPIIQGIKPSEHVSLMGLNFKQDNSTEVSSYGKWQKKAFELMQKSGWN